MKTTTKYSQSQTTALVALRILIGWYFMYEGIAKILTPNWSSYAYLIDSKGLFAPIFHFLTQSEGLMTAINLINMYGLTIIGFCMITGCFVRWVNFGAIALLLLYYFSHPPLIDVQYMIRPEGSYLWVDKNLVMLAAVCVQMVFPSSHIIGLDRWIKNKKNKD